MALKQISYTYLHLLACSYATFLKYEGRIKGGTTPALAVGNAVHLALEMMYKPQGIIPIEGAIGIFNVEYNKLVQEDQFFGTYPQIKKGQAEGIEMIERYYAQTEKGFLSQSPLAVEQEFRLPIGDTVIVGKIDKVEKEADGYVVTDYKTGSRKPDEWFLRRNLQFTAYYWACKELYGEYPVRVQWHHLRTGQILTSERSEWDIEQLKRIVDAAVHMQDEQLRYRVYHEQVCGWCPYSGFNKECDDTNLEQEILDQRV